jgi:hypothetical protein
MFLFNRVRISSPREKQPATGKDRRYCAATQAPGYFPPVINMPHPRLNGGSVSINFDTRINF